MNYYLINKKLKIIFYLYIILGLSIAFAPSFGPIPVGFISVTLLAVTVYIAVERVKIIYKFKKIDDLIVLMGVICLILILAGLGIAQIIHNQKALFWNVDNRYFATLANTIIKYGDLSQSLEFAGASGMYHAGPSWIAAAWSIIFKIPINTSLFFILPVLYIISIVLGLYFTLRNLGVSKSPAIISTFIGLMLPNHLPHLYEIVIQFLISGDDNLLLNPHNFIISIRLMQNSLLAMAVFFPSLYLIVSSQKQSLDYCMGIAGLISIFAIKPQLFLIGSIILCPIFIAKTINQKKYLLTLLIISISSLLLGLIYFSNASSTASVFGGIEFIDSIKDEVHVRFNEVFEHRRSSIITYMFFGLILCLWLLRHYLKFDSVIITIPRLIFGVMLAYTFLFVFNFPASSASIDKAKNFGFHLDYLNSDFDQGIYLATILGYVFCMVFMIENFKLKFPNLRFVYVKYFILFVIFIPLCMLRIYSAAIPIANPMGEHAYEWSNENDLYFILKKYRPEGIIISNDLSDSADDFSRPLLAVNLTSLGVSNFFLTNLRYGNFLNENSLERLFDVHRFFGSQWSSWHINFLIDNNINYILISNRCDIRWNLQQPYFEIIEVGGRWTLVKFNKYVKFKNINASNDFERINIKQHSSNYGLSPCLGNINVDLISSR